MPRVSEQVEWLSLVDISGPFLVPAVLEQVFPQGLEKVQTPRRQRIRSAYEEWRDAVDDDDPQLGEMHAAWVLMVLQDMLEYEDEVLVTRKSLDGKCIYRAPEHGVEYAPDYAVRGEDGKLRMLIAVWPPETDLEKPLSGDSWTASPLERMTLLCRATVIRLGLVTDGERWMLVNAPVGATSGYAAWLARLWWQEPVTLKAFQSLLGVRRFFGPKEETLEALLEKSAEFQEEVTDTLGEQVRRAVEILVQSLGRADQDRNGELLKDVRPAELYEAGLTVMMRMVFTLCAEERGLLLLGDPVYDQHYALSTLRARLREDADRYGVEVLERRHDAWSRMLAVFRAIYGGVEHESLRMPALGGSLFDPDRFPLLEGRAKGTSWRDTPSIPLPIDNRTVLLLLDALQVLEQKGGARLLSYRALDVEQIGHVYEGLLEYTVARLDEVTVGLIGSQKVRHPSIALTELEALKAGGTEKVVESLAETTGRSPAAIRRALERESDDETLVRLVHACGGDEKLARRLLPFADLIREDSWGTPVVYKPGSFAVVPSSDRRETGTHYTPRSLTESIVEKTLEPVVYAGSAEGEPRERWKLKTPAEILELKVCDPAMGSGAFLVQVCRYLAERLVEAWAREEAAGKAITADGVVLEALGKADPLPKSLDERLVVARRLIAERCLYGVDINPLAVELAKLSIWLVTMAKGRPFGFLDHNLRSGDSLLGIHRLDQLTKLTMNPDEPGQQQRLFGQNIAKAVEEALAIRAKLRSIPIRDIRDVETMARLDTEARKKLEAVELVADAMIGKVLANSGQPRRIDSALDSLAIEAGEFLNGDMEAGKRIALDAQTTLSLELPKGRAPRRPFHWPLEFPESFGSHTSGFDAVLGNPPWGYPLPDIDIAYFKEYFPNSNYKLINSFKFFIERMAYLVRCGAGMFSFVVPSSLLEHIGCRDTRAFLLRNTLYLLVDCGDGVFQGVTQSSCYAIAGRCPASESHEFCIAKYARCTFTEGGNTLGSIVRSEFKISAREALLRTNHVFSVGAKAYASQTGFVKLKEIADVYDSGIDYSRAKLGDAVFYVAERPQSASDHRVLRGRNIRKYWLGFEGIWLRHNWADIEADQRSQDKKSRLKVNLTVYRLSPKILVRQTGDSIIATVDTDRYYHQKSLLAICPHNAALAYYLCAILNHPAMTTIYQSITMQRGKVFSQVKKNFLEQLPIPYPVESRITDAISSLCKDAIKCNMRNMNTEAAAKVAEVEKMVGSLMKKLVPKSSQENQNEE